MQKPAVAVARPYRSGRILVKMIERARRRVAMDPPRGTIQYVDLPAFARRADPEVAFSIHVQGADPAFADAVRICRIVEIRTKRIDAAFHFHQAVVRADPHRSE